MKAFVEVVLLCAQQEICLRGYRESSEARNRGNFLEILEVLAPHDPVVSQRLKEGQNLSLHISRNAKHFLNLMGKMVREQICGEVRHTSSVITPIIRQMIRIYTFYCIVVPSAYGSNISTACNKILLLTPPHRSNTHLKYNLTSCGACWQVTFDANSGVSMSYE